MLSTSQDKPSRKHPDLVSLTLRFYPLSQKHINQVLATTLCMLAKARNDHASDFPTTMCMYFLACGTSRSVFDVLNHAGVTLSYTQAVAKIKQLGGERLTMMREIARSRAFMVIWDNLNIAFKVSEQRHDSKDHFDNGTTVTLLPLYDVEFGGLPLELLPSIYSHLIHHKCCEWRYCKVYIFLVQKEWKRKTQSLPTSCSDVNDDIFPAKSCSCDIKLPLKRLLAVNLAGFSCQHIQVNFFSLVFSDCREVWHAGRERCDSLLFQFNINSVEVDKRWFSSVEKSFLFANLNFSIRKIILRDFTEIQLILVDLPCRITECIRRCAGSTTIYR
jgi:hypothetical protein